MKKKSPLSNATSEEDSNEEDDEDEDEDEDEDKEYSDITDEEICDICKGAKSNKKNPLINAIIALTLSAQPHCYQKSLKILVFILIYYFVF